MTEMEKFGLPAGRYTATISTVDLIPSRGRTPWRMRIGAVVARNGKEVAVWRDLAKSGRDPYDITANQRKSLRAFAVKIGAQGTGPVEEIVASIRALADHEVTAHVRPSKVGMAVTFYRDAAPPLQDQKAIAGEVLDAVPDVEPEYRQRTLEAQGAHEQLIAGLHHAHRGLALASEACWKLKENDGWVALGYDSVGAYLASPEVAMSRSTFYALVDIWEQYVQVGGVDERRLCAPSKLEVPLVALKNGEVTAEEALSDAEVMGLRDLRDKYRTGSNGTKKPKESGRPEFPFACRACGVVIEDEEGVRAVDGIIYEGHRWPDGWNNEQVMAAVTAAGRAA